MEQRYTHTACVLFDSVPERSKLARTLEGLGNWSWPVATPESQGTIDWALSSSGLTLESPGGPTVTVSIVKHKWPDRSHNVNGSRAPLFGRSLPALGSTVRPGGLARSARNAALLPNARTMVSRHRAFVRIRTSYPAVSNMAHRADLDNLGSELVRSLELVTQIGARIMRVPGALCWYAPSGEVLASEPTLRILERRTDWEDRPPIEVWVGVEQRLSEATNELEVNSVGAFQLGMNELRFVDEATPAAALTARANVYDGIFAALSLSRQPRQSANVVPFQPRSQQERTAHSSTG